MLAGSPFWIYVTSLTLLCLQDSSSSYVSLNGDGGYENIVIAISPSITEKEGTALISKLENLFKETSKLLHDATNEQGHPLFFKQLVFLIPHHWTLPAIVRESTYYAKADIRVIKDDTTGKLPGITTEQTGGCTKPGEFIQLTSAFITGEADERKQAQRLLQHWARYRYGIFPEEGIEGSHLNPTQYRDKNGAQQTGCTKPNPWKRICSSGNSEGCTFTLEPGVDVQYSLMDDAELKAKLFCDNASHNPEAPTIHNVLCDRRSIWEVLKQHQDFQGAPPSPSTPATLSLIRVKAQPLQAVLVVDHQLWRNDIKDGGVSQTVRLAIGNALKNVFPSTKLGIVFANYKENEITLVEARTDAAVEEWRNLSSVNYNTSYTNSDFQRAIEDGIKFLKKNITLNEGGVLIVLGKMDTNTGVKQHLTDVMNAIKTGPKVNSYLISYPGTNIKPEDKEIVQKFSQQATWYNKKLPIETGVNLEGWKQINEALRDIISRYTADFYPASTTILSEILEPSVKKKFFVGSSTNKARVSVHYAKSPVQLSIDGTITTTVNDDKAQTQSFEPPILDEGVHQIQVTQAAYVTIDDNSPENLFSFTVKVKESQDEKGPTAIYASVRLNNLPVENASISAVLVSLEDDATELSFQLLDSGNGDPDILPGDGVYSRYVMPPKSGFYQLVVRYNGKITETSSSKGAAVSYAGDDGSLISISKSLGSVHFNEMSKDYPPNRILDFKLVELTQETGNVAFSWTAPGANYDQGQASKYEVKCSICSDDVADKDSFTRQEFQTQGMNQPLPAGTQETLKWTISPDDSNNGKLLYCAIRAENKNGATNLPSNVVAFQIFVPQPTTTTTLKVPDVTTTKENTTEPATAVVPTPENLVLETLQAIRAAVIGGTVTLVLLLVILIGVFVFFKWKQLYNPKVDRRDDFRMSQPTETRKEPETDEVNTYTPEPHASAPEPRAFAPERHASAPERHASAPEPHASAPPKDRPKSTNRNTAPVPGRPLPNIPSEQTPDTSAVNQQHFIRKSQPKVPMNLAGQRGSDRPSSSKPTEEHYINMGGPHARGDGAKLQLAQNNYEEAIYDDVVA